MKTQRYLQVPLPTKRDIILKRLVSETHKLLLHYPIPIDNSIRGTHAESLIVELTLKQVIITGSSKRS